MLKFFFLVCSSLGVKTIVLTIVLMTFLLCDYITGLNSAFHRNKVTYGLQPCIKMCYIINYGLNPEETRQQCGTFLFCLFQRQGQQIQKQLMVEVAHSNVTQDEHLCSPQELIKAKLLYQPSKIPRIYRCAYVIQHSPVRTEKWARLCHS